MKNPITSTLEQSEERSYEAGSSETSPSLLELIAERSTAHTIGGGVIVGKLTGFDETGNPLVNFVADVSHEAVVARSMISLKKNQIGFDVVLAFEHGNLEKPILAGMLLEPASPLWQEPTEAKLDGERVVLTAEREIVLRCGTSSITLTRAGKVLIRGAYVLSRSSGVNRIKGGSVQIN